MGVCLQWAQKALILFHTFPLFAPLALARSQTSPAFAHAKARSTGVIGWSHSVANQIVALCPWLGSPPEFSTFLHIIVKEHVAPRPAKDKASSGKLGARQVSEGSDLVVAPVRQPAQHWTLTAGKPMKSLARRKHALNTWLEHPARVTLDSGNEGRARKPRKG